MSVTYVGGAAYATPAGSEQSTALTIPAAAQADDVGLLIIAGQNTGTHSVTGWSQVGAVTD